MQDDTTFAYWLSCSRYCCEYKVKLVYFISLFYVMKSIMPRLKTYGGQSWKIHCALQQKLTCLWFSVCGVNPLAHDLTSFVVGTSYAQHHNQTTTDSCLTLRRLFAKMLKYNTIESNLLPGTKAHVPRETLAQVCTTAFCFMVVIWKFKRSIVARFVIPQQLARY